MSMFDYDSSNSMRAVNSALRSNSIANDAVISKYLQNPMYKSWVQDILRESRETITNNDQRAKATAAVGGYSNEWVANQKANMATLASQSATNIAKGQSDNDKTAAQIKINENNNSANQLISQYRLDDQQRSALTGALITGVGGAVQSAVGAFV